MREVIVRLNEEELLAIRRLETDYAVVNSGSVELELDYARGILDAHRAWWVTLYEKYNELEDEEFHEVDTVRGFVFVDKE